MEVHGFLNVDKPLGWTSHDVVGRLRRILGMKRIGHAGTLDPAATGVLVVGVGRATRFLDYVQYGSKQYLAHVVLGVESDTADIDGRIEKQAILSSEPPTVPDIENALASLTGEIAQVPPKYSAIKQGGEPLYVKARRGERVEVPVRQVQIDAIQIISYCFPDLILQIDCGPGVYIRSLARDTGAPLGTGAYLHHLVRTRVGRFSLSDSQTLESLGHASFPSQWTSYATATDVALVRNDALFLNKETLDAWYHGRSIAGNAANRQLDDAMIRTYTANGHFAGASVVESTSAAERISSFRPKIVLPRQ
jgi:tRNA pseudouridine55 synthase